MTRWTNNFNQHPFKNKWEGLKSHLSSIAVLDETVITDVEELARLRKVISYIDGLIKAIDAELTPSGVWNNFEEQGDSCSSQIQQYAIDRNIDHLRKANDHADNLLTYVRPYQVLPYQVAESLTNSIEKFSETIDSYSAAVQEKLLELLTNAKFLEAQSKQKLSHIEESSLKIDQFLLEMLDGNENQPSIKSKIQQAFENVKKFELESNQFHNKIFTEIDGLPSIKSKIDEAEKQSEEIKNEMTEMLLSIKSQINNLSEFYKKIFGSDLQGDEQSKGLEAELNERMAALIQFKDDQSEKYKTLFEKIESLLPGATSVGLARAYAEERQKFKAPVKKYTNIFYVTIGLLIISGFTIPIQGFQLTPPIGITWEPLNDWDSILKGILQKTPYVAPLLWLAIFSTKRRSQYERLEQEYAHKEVLASSYESYRKQIEILKIGIDDLQKDLIQKAMDAISFNPSLTLDGSNRENIPSIELLQKLVEEIKNIKSNNTSEKEAV